MGGHFAATLQARDRAGDAAVARFENFIRIADELGIINHERLNQVSASLATGGNPWTDADGDVQNVKRIAGDGP